MKRYQRSLCRVHLNKDCTYHHVPSLLQIFFCRVWFADMIRSITYIAVSKILEIPTQTSAGSLKFHAKKAKNIDTHSSNYIIYRSGKQPSKSTMLSSLCRSIARPIKQNPLASKSCTCSRLARGSKLQPLVGHSRLSFRLLSVISKEVEQTNSKKVFLSGRHQSTATAATYDTDTDEDDSDLDESTSTMATEEEKREIIDSIKHKSRLPSVVYLYDDIGSDLFEDITKTKEYYLTRTELSILKDNATHMARFQDEHHQESRAFQHSLIELGAGSGKKLHPLLDALENVPKTGKCSYVPADYSGSALEENVQVYNRDRQNVEPFEGTHEDAFRALSRRPGRKTWAYLGSSLGNDLDPVPFLKQIASHCGPRDRVFLGIDLATHQDKPIGVINAAYNDSEGITEKFILNSLAVVSQRAGLQNLDQDKFRLLSEYNTTSHAVEMFAECVVPCTVTANDGTEFVRSFEKGDRIFIEQSGKFAEEKIKDMIETSGFVQKRRWSDTNGYFAIIELGPNLAGTATGLNEFIFKGLIGEENLSHQPILLRNPFAFYWGHISSFSDRISLDLPGREHEREIFERGVDPDVDDPTKIHRHSPRHQDAWPTPEEFKKYDKEVEHGLCQQITEGGVNRDMLMALGHAEMHHETLMYMVMQSDKKNKQANQKHPFADFAPPPTESRSIPSEKFVHIKSTQVNLGASAEQEAALGFVWDNELPHHKASVNSFNCAAFPVTNGEFQDFVQDGGYTNRSFWDNNEINDTVVSAGGSGAWDWIRREEIQRPLFWEDKGVRTLYDLVPHDKARDWPAVVSLYEAAAYCKWLGNGARIMTEGEYHALFEGQEDYNHAARQGNNNWKYQGVVPVGSMDDATSKGVSDLVGNGWEWTSTPFAGFTGFKPLPDYDEYSADFFDDKHFVMKGASPFTGILAQRMSFRNFYQPNYPYPIAKFRIVTN